MKINDVVSTFRNVVIHVLVKETRLQPSHDELWNWKPNKKNNMYSVGLGYAVEQCL